MTVHVIGAGVSGLAAATYLSDAGQSVHVFDAGPRPGGLIHTHHLDQGLVETAARAFTSTDRTIALFKTAGIAPIVPRPHSKRRYIFRDGTPRRWPLSAIESASVIGHATVAWLLRRMNARNEETVDDWGRRVLGRAGTDWLIAPALQGIYASAPSELSAAAVFGGRGRTRGPLLAPANGMGDLLDRLADRLRDRGGILEFNTTVDRIEPHVRTVIATGAPAAARLLAPHAPRLADRLARVRMVSLVIATMFFEPNVRDTHGFGVLFPRQSGVRALGVLFNADIFDHRSALRSETWFYGDLKTSALPTDIDLATVIAADRERLTRRPRDMPIAMQITRHSNALPVYDAAILAVKDASVELPPWIALAGNYLGRLGVSALLDVAHDAATHVCSVSNS